MLSEVDIEPQVPAIMQPLERLFRSHSAIVAFPLTTYEHGAEHHRVCTPWCLDSHDVLQCVQCTT